MTGQALIVQGDALHLPLPDASVDLIVTSPPYWALRTYSAGPGEIGSEPTPAEYLEALWAATAEMMRVLKPSGSMFVDLGDKYSEGRQVSTARSGHKDPAMPKQYGWRGRSTGLNDSTTPPKSLMLLPERYRIGCVDRLGLIARAVIVWNKANSLPESVQDRVRRSHEEWVHLARLPRYYSAVDEIRESYSPGSAERVRQGFRDKQVLNGIGAGQRRPGELAEGYEPNPLGKLPGSVWTLGDGDEVGPFPFPWTCPKCGTWIPNAWRLGMHDAVCDGRRKEAQRPGSVWTIPSEPLRLPEHLGVQHYAAFPSEWPRRLVLAFSPPGICLDCGQGRVPVVERGEPQVVTGGYKAAELTASYGYGNHGTGGSTLGYRREATILGYACSCTPYTDPPGTPRDGPRNSGNGWAGNTGDRDNPGGGYGNNPRTGPWREYHLDGWKPPPTRPAIILDPFSGTGTTPMVARVLGRIGVGVDLSHAYCRAARWRVQHDGAKAISRTNLERQGSLL